jgi:hypothetical protein
MYILHVYIALSILLGLALLEASQINQLQELRELMSKGPDGDRAVLKMGLLSDGSLSSATNENNQKTIKQ